jgi:uncharacterized membrane protein YuzA (DUF378 family)
MWEWVQFIALILGGVVFVLYMVFRIVVGLAGIYDFLRFYYRLFSGTLSIREMRDDIKNGRW